MRIYDYCVFFELVLLNLVVCLGKLFNYICRYSSIGKNEIFEEK